MRHFCWQNRFSFIFIFAVFFTTFVVILPCVCKSWSYSKFFQDELNSKSIVKTALDQNAQRLKAAEEYLGSIKPNHHSTVKHQLDMAVGIISISRDKYEADHQSGYQGYLTQSVASLMETAVKDKHYTKHLFICNVDTYGDLHTEAVRLSKYISMEQRFNNRTENLSAVSSMDIFEKEKDDYSFCLKRALFFKPKYIILFEDDVQVRSNLFSAVYHLLNYVTRSNVRQDEDIASIPWLFLKLYYPEKWQGYGLELEKIMELIAIGTVGGSLFVFLITLIEMLKSRDSRSKPILHQLVFFVLGSIFFLCLVVLIGRPYVHHLRRVSDYLHRVITAPGCCTQAILYPADIVDNLINYLDKSKCSREFSIDLAIDKFANNTHLKRFLVEPNLVNHIGMISTVRSKAKTAAEFIL